jgi:Domain of unknown function (DUF4404)
MRGYHDECRVVEMDLMQQPPYIIDFAKVRIDRPPDFADEVVADNEARGSDLFGAEWPRVKHLLESLESFQIYCLDPTPYNDRVSLAMGGRISATARPRIRALDRVPGCLLTGRSMAYVGDLPEDAGDLLEARPLRPSTYAPDAMQDEIPRLRQTLHELHEELGAIETRDPEVRQLLANALADIAAALSQREAGAEAADAESANSGSLGTQLEEAAREFEATHPKLVGLVQSVADALARIGI